MDKKLYNEILCWAAHDSYREGDTKERLNEEEYHNSAHNYILS